MNLLAFLRNRRPARTEPARDRSPRRRQPRQDRAFESLPDPWGSDRKTAEPMLERYRQAVSMQWAEDRERSSRLDLDLLDEALRINDEMSRWEEEAMKAGHPLHRWWISSPKFPVREAQLLDWWQILSAGRLLTRRPMFDLFLQRGDLAQVLRTMYFWGFRRGYGIAAHEIAHSNEAPSAAVPQAFRDAFPRGDGGGTEQ